MYSCTVSSVHFVLFVLLYSTNIHWCTHNLFSKPQQSHDKLDTESQKNSRKEERKEGRKDDGRMMDNGQTHYDRLITIAAFCANDNFSTHMVCEQHIHPW